MTFLTALSFLVVIIGEVGRASAPSKQSKNFSDPPGPRN
jgi:hypothetical protein